MLCHSICSAAHVDGSAAFAINTTWGGDALPACVTATCSPPRITAPCMLGLQLAAVAKQPTVVPNNITSTQKQSKMVLQVAPVLMPASTLNKAAANIELPAPAISGHA